MYKKVNGKIIGFKNDSSLNNYFILNYFAKKNKEIICNIIAPPSKARQVSGFFYATRKIF